VTTNCNKEVYVRLTGKISKWNGDKAFGFITPNGGGNAIFIHKTALKSRQRTPKINDVMTFSVVQDKRGRYCADQATFSDEKKLKQQTSHISTFSIYLPLLFITLITLSYLFGYLPQNILILYLAVSFMTFITYAFDKTKAQRGTWRTQESTLHLFALLGGWPGAALAQQLLRHKSKKQKFRVTFWFTVVINTAALSWLLTDRGEPFLRFFS